MQIEPLVIPSGPAALTVLPRLADALRGGAPIAPYAAGSPPQTLPPPLPPAPEQHRPGQTEGRGQDGAERLPNGLPDDLAVVVGTSGSTGTPKLAMLTARALAASIGGTHRHLGGPGQWLLALPGHHIAGLQVLLRGLVAGTQTITLGDQDSKSASGKEQPRAAFSVEGFVRATARLTPEERHYTALVPTQVSRLLDDPAGAEALRGFDAVLVGGAALPPHLRHRADSEGIVLVATYGMSETAGGCIYDGHPLPASTFRLEADGRILLGGTTLASGYLDDPDRTDHAFVSDPDGTRWFRTDDHGHVLPDGRLHVDGRLDDLINTGGLKVAPRLVEEAITAHLNDIAEVVVVGVPDSQWGQRVSALVVLRSGQRTDDAHHLRVSEVRDRLRGILPDHALPQQVETVDALPLRGPGKPDRAAIVTLLREAATSHGMG